MAYAIIFTNGKGELFEYDPADSNLIEDRSIDLDLVIDTFEMASLRLRQLATRVKLLLPSLRSEEYTTRKAAIELLLELSEDGKREGAEYSELFDHASKLLYSNRTM